MWIVIRCEEKEVGWRRVFVSIRATDLVAIVSKGSQKCSSARMDTEILPVNPRQSGSQVWNLFRQWNGQAKDL